MYGTIGRRTTGTAIALIFSAVLLTPYEVAAVVLELLRAGSVA